MSAIANAQVQWSIHTLLYDHCNRQFENQCGKKFYFQGGYGSLGELVEDKHEHTNSGDDVPGVVGESEKMNRYERLFNTFVREPHKQLNEDKHQPVVIITAASSRRLEWPDWIIGVGGHREFPNGNRDKLKSYSHSSPKLKLLFSKQYRTGREIQTHTGADFKTGVKRSDYFEQQLAGLDE